MPATHGYAGEATVTWSAKVSLAAGFAFVTPQYSWAILRRWRTRSIIFMPNGGKVALIVSYGGHGGGKAAAQLQRVLAGGLHMRMAAEAVELTLPQGAIKANAGTIDCAAAFPNAGLIVAAALAALTDAAAAGP